MFFLLQLTTVSLTDKEIWNSMQWELGNALIQKKRGVKLMLWNANTNAFRVTDDTCFAMLPAKMPYNCIETIEQKNIYSQFFVSSSRSSRPLWKFVDIFSLCCDMKNRLYVLAECQTSDKLALLLCVCVQFYETIFCV